MLEKILKFLGKNELEPISSLNLDEKGLFVLFIDKISIGELRFESGEWIFKYTEEFKRHSDKYHYIIGFPNLDKEYRSNSLWPFFLTRIPGLKQPAIKEILKEESIDKSDEFALLKRFGKRTITNPYTLEYC